MNVLLKEVLGRWTMFIEASELFQTSIEVFGHLARNKVSHSALLQRLCFLQSSRAFRINPWAVHLPFLCKGHKLETEEHLYCRFIWCSH